MQLPPWIDNTCRRCDTRENIDVPAGTSLIAFRPSKLATDASKPSWAWGGCVRQRTEKVNGADVNYDVQDIAPDPANPDTLFTPFFAPDEPDGADSGGNDDCTCPAGQDCTCNNIASHEPLADVKQPVRAGTRRTQNSTRSALQNTPPRHGHYPLLD